MNQYKNVLKSFLAILKLEHLHKIMREFNVMYFSSAHWFLFEIRIRNFNEFISFKKFRVKYIISFHYKNM